MNWILLTDQTHNYTESTLQSIFDYWLSGRQGWIVSGLPLWMTCRVAYGKGRRFSAKNYECYSFEPDAIWEGNINYIFELKRNSKYEPLGLPEVLHHAYKLNGSEYAKKKLVPILICSSTDGNWERASLNYLFANGLSRESIHYLQATYLSTSDGVRLLWFEEPFARFEKCERLDLPGIYDFGQLGPTVHYHKCVNAKTWAISKEVISDFSNTPQGDFIYISSTERDQEYAVYNRAGNNHSFWIVSTSPGSVQLPTAPRLTV